MELKSERTTFREPIVSFTVTHGYKEVEAFEFNSSKYIQCRSYSMGWTLLSCISNQVELDIMMR